MGNNHNNASPELQELVKKIANMDKQAYESKLKKTWDKYNKDHNEFLDAEESKELVSHLVQILFPKISEAEIDATSAQVFDVLDSNDDGIVTFGEFHSKLNSLLRGLQTEHKSLDSIAQTENSLLIKKKQESMDKDEEQHAQHVLIWSKAKHTDELFDLKVQYFATKDAKKRAAVLSSMLLDTVFHGTVDLDIISECWICVTAVEQQQVTAIVQFGIEKFENVQGSWKFENDQDIIILPLQTKQIAYVDLHIKVEIEKIAVTGKVFNHLNGDIGKIVCNKPFEN